MDPIGSEEVVSRYRTRDKLVGVAALLSNIESRDHYSGRHTLRVTEVATALGWVMELPEASIRKLRYGALLHDMGRFSLSDELLTKRGQLTGDEQRQWYLHPEEGARMAKELGFPEECHPVIMHHHERYDGRGYPGGLKGEDIPLEARVLHVADVVDALRTPRPYRRALSAYEITVELEYGEGKDFDPGVMSALGRLDLGLLLGRQGRGGLSNPGVPFRGRDIAVTASDLKAVLGRRMPGQNSRLFVRPTSD
jgi:putative nucleotidyltransferase with HDIG domain